MTWKLHEWKLDLSKVISNRELSVASLHGIALSPFHLTRGSGSAVICLILGLEHVNFLIYAAR